MNRFLQHIVLAIILLVLLPQLVRSESLELNDSQQPQTPKSKKTAVRIENLTAGFDEPDRAQVTVSPDISPLDFMTEEEIQAIQKEGFQLYQAEPEELLAKKGLRKPVFEEFINIDYEGKPIRFPQLAFFDKSMDETYILHGNSITIYGPDYYPRFVIGPGRGIFNAQGGFVDHDGMVYICQSGTAKGVSQPRLTILNGAFFVEDEYIFDDHQETRGFRPRRVAVKPNGEVFIAAAEDKRGVLVLDSTWKFSRWITPLDNNGMAIKINEVDITADGKLFLLSEDICKIFVFSEDEKQLYSFGELGGVAGKMSRPKGIALDEVNQRLYAVDYMRHTILVFGFDGQFLFEFGGRGWSQGWYNFPTDVAIGLNNRLLVVDSFNHRIQVFRLD